MSLDTTQATNVLSSYASAYRSAVQDFNTKSKNLSREQNTLYSLIAANATTTTIATQAAVVNDLQSQVAQATTSLKALNTAKQSAQNVLLPSQTGPTGPTSNPFVGSVGDVGPTGPAGQPWSTPMDALPTQGSSNAVTSGGTYSAIQAVSAIAVGTTSNIPDTTVKLLCHFNGANNSTSFTDSSSYNTTITGSGGKLTTSNKKFGVSSLSGSVTIPSITLPSNAPWSIEYWFYATAYPATNAWDVHFTINGATTHTVGFWNWSGGFRARWAYNNNSSIITQMMSGLYFPVGYTGGWNHVKWMRTSAGTVYTVLNGSAGDSGGSMSGDISGSVSFGNSNLLIDELRVTVGSPITWPVYTVPTNEFSAYSNNFPSPATQGQLWTNGTQVYVCVESGNPGTWKQVLLES